MDYIIRPYRESDSANVLSIFNGYVKSGVAAFPEAPLGNEFTEKLAYLARTFPVLVAQSVEDTCLGFGFLRPWNPLPVFKRTAEVAYFLDPDYRGKGIGSRLLGMLENEASKMSVDCLLACIHSENEESLRFHLRRGFVEKGRFDSVGKRKGQDISVVYMARRL